MIDFTPDFHPGGSDAEIAGHAGARAERSVERLAHEVERLEQRIDKLSLVTQALWTLLQEKTEVTEAELEQCVARLEAKQLTAQEQIACPQCGRAMLARDRRCVYCDYRAPNDDVFSSVTR